MTATQISSSVGGKGFSESRGLSNRKRDVSVRRAIRRKLFPAHYQAETVSAAKVKLNRHPR